MTENEVRKKVVAVLNGWVGGKAGSDIHKEILAIYNEYAKAHKMAQAYQSYPWCDITASAAWIKAGLAKYVPISMSCGDSIAKAKKMGIWQERDDYVPKFGDACIYDWSDSGKGDDTSGHDHIGIVTSAGEKTFTVCEGNAGSPGQVKKIRRTVNQRYIRGFICPNYKQAAKDMTPAEKPKEDPTPSPAKPDHVGAQTYTKSKAGTYKVIAKAGLYLRKGPATTYEAIKVMPYNASVTCYGYHTKLWYLVQYKDNGKIYEGFCSSEYLKK